MPRMNLILTNANVYTVDSAQTRAQQPRATAIAISHGRIIAVGSDDDVQNISLPGAQTINLNGAFVLPGLIDAHLHLEQTGHALQRVLLWDVPSMAEVEVGPGHVLANITKRLDRDARMIDIFDDSQWAEFAPTLPELEIQTFTPDPTPRIVRVKASRG